MLLEACRRITFVVACAAVLAAGCGGLRRAPITNDGGMGGIGMGFGGIGGGMFIDSGTVDVPVSNCVAGGTCVPANSCHKGMFVCIEGAMSCMELADTQANGTVCGADMVCRDGTCGACIADMTCDVTGQPCRVGGIVCTTGAPVCTAIDNKPNGTACGTGRVCQAGQCQTCQMGAPCQPTNKCHNGTLNCSGSASTCMDANTNVAAGTSCGTDMVCSASGTCTGCMQGMDCPVAGKPCSKGQITCNTGAPVCVESGNMPNGTPCGANMVCSGGSCDMCTAGTACTPANKCHAGITVCSPSIACSDTGNALTNGTVCDQDRVCNAGTCVSCQANTSCTLTNSPCKRGVISCVSGSPMCVEAGNQPDGMTCGTGMVCMAGSCVTCNMGGACTPISNPCHRGMLDCSTGSAVCNDSGQNQTDGTTCGTNQVCRAGSCVPCTAGLVCLPMNPCKNGTTVCTSGTEVCMETTNKSVGTPCGAPMSCTNGVVRGAEACNAQAMCVAAVTQCPSGTCNPSGTDCATCPNGQTSCPTGCKDLTRDLMNCGQCGNVCPAPAANTGIAVCAGSICSISCNAGYLECHPDPGQSLAMCQQAGWNFEDMSLGGFRIVNSPSAAVRLVNSNLVANTGKHSLGIQISAMGIAMAPTRTYVVGQPLCASRGWVKVKNVIVWLAIAPDDDRQLFGPKSWFGVRIFTERGEFVGAEMAPRINAWFPVVVPVEMVGSQLQAIALEGYFEPGGLAVPGPWNGFVYVDDVVLE